MTFVVLLNFEKTFKSTEFHRFWGFDSLFEYFSAPLRWKREEKNISFQIERRNLKIVSNEILSILAKENRAPTIRNLFFALFEFCTLNSIQIESSPDRKIFSSVEIIFFLFVQTKNRVRRPSKLSNLDEQNFTVDRTTFLLSSSWFNAHRWTTDKNDTTRRKQSENPLIRTSPSNVRLCSLCFFLWQKNVTNRSAKEAKKCAIEMSPRRLTKFHQKTLEKHFNSISHEETSDKARRARFFLFLHDENEESSWTEINWVFFQ